MTSDDRPPRRSLSTALLLIPLLGSMCWVMAMPLLSPKREEMRIGKAPVVVDYMTAAGAEELGMPFYPEADLGESFAYMVTTKDGARVVSYAEATLVSSATTDEVIDYYGEELPGHPTPEVLDDGGVQRRVLAVGNDQEVRQVTVVEADDGCRIRLVRSTTPIPPPRPLKPHERAI
jgi:hypothetical protein